MDIFGVLTMIGGLALFLYGMHVMGDGLAKTSGGKLEQILEKFTSSPMRAVLLGAGVTAVIQSSSATTVMVVGFVNSGIMKLNQAVGIIMGANIGTTVTSWLLSLTGIQGDNLFVELLKPSSFTPILAIVGVSMILFAKSSRPKDIGTIMIGFSVLMFGMDTMSAAVKPLADVPQFTHVLTMFSNPILGMLAGAILTAIIQSSSASVGILQALCLTGSVPYATAIPIIMGQNIGTCITALLSAIGASKNAKRTAALHLSFNIIGTIVFMALLYGGNALFHFPFWENVMDRGSIANLHLGFNLGCTVLLLPFHKQLVRLVEHLVPGDTDERELSVLDDRFLASPSLALEKAHDAVVQMGDFARDNLKLSVELIKRFDAKKLERLNETETALDKLEGLLDNYLVKLTDRALTSEESMKVSELLHTLSDFERIGDYAVNVSESAVILHERGIAFSVQAQAELDGLTDAVIETMDKTRWSRWRKWWT